jgi:hypothetical protein
MSIHWRRHTLLIKRQQARVKRWLILRQYDVAYINLRVSPRHETYGAYLTTSSLFKREVVIYDGFVLIIIGEIAILRIPKVSSGIVCERACLNVDDLSHSAKELEVADHYKAYICACPTIILRNGDHPQLEQAGTSTTCNNLASTIP